MGRVRFSPAEYQPFWIKHAPQHVDQVSMHKAKIKEIQIALESTARLVIVSGPTGAGKSTVIRLLLRQMRRKLIEWHSPESSVGETSIIDSFGDFLVGASLHGSSAVVFIDELPNILHQGTLQEFTKSVEYYLSVRDAPQLVFAFTETDSAADYREHVVVSRVFAPFLNHKRVSHIKVNAVNATLIKSALQAVTVAELGRKGAETDKAVQALASAGDIRSALLQYEMWLKGNRSLLPVPRDSSAGFFHGIGKIVYGSETGVDAIVAQHDELDSFNLTLLENYTNAHHQRLSLLAAESCAEWQSIADLGEPVRGLAVYGVFHEIQSSDPDETQPKKFRPLSFTPVQKSASEQARKQAQLTSYLLRQRRQGDSLSNYDGLVQDGYHLNETRHLDLDWDDSESELESDW